jgi:hypothetical protein
VDPACVTGKGGFVPRHNFNLDKGRERMTTQG